MHQQDVVIEYRYLSPQTSKLVYLGFAFLSLLSVGAVAYISNKPVQMVWAPKKRRDFPFRYPTSLSNCVVFLVVVLTHSRCTQEFVEMHTTLPMANVIQLFFGAAYAHLPSQLNNNNASLGTSQLPQIHQLPQCGSTGPSIDCATNTRAALRASDRRRTLNAVFLLNHK